MDKNIPIEWNTRSIPNGFGYLTIPIDRDRDEYLRDFYRVGYCILITMYNEVKRQVIVPVHLLTLCEFPQIPGEKGSLVHWMRVPGSGQLVITGIHLTSDKFGVSSENRNSESVVGDSGTINITKNLEINGYQISVQGSRLKPGEIVLTVSDGENHSRLSLSGSGITVLEASSLQIEVDDLSTIISELKTIRFDEEELVINFDNQSVRVAPEGIVIKSDKIISLQSKNSSVSVTDRGIVVETDKQIYLQGNRPVLYAKSTSAKEIVDVSEIGISKTVRVS